jgi:hypothetical protein
VQREQIACADFAQRRVLPARQRLGPRHRPADAGELRLEQHFDLAPVERAQQIGFERARTHAREATPRWRAQ